MIGTATARNLVGPLVRRGYRLRISGAHHCPRRGPLIVAAPLLGAVDPTIVSTCLPRPVDVLVDAGALTALGARLPGRIVVSDDNPGEGLAQARAVLDDAGAVGAWSEAGRERAAGYLALRTGADVLPVAVLGGSGRHPGDPPPWRAAIDVVIGEPFPVEVSGDPLTRAAVLEAGEIIRQHVADHLRAARVRTARADGAVDGPMWPAQDNGAL